eukprot:gene11542-biopygen6373
MQERACARSQGAQKRRMPPPTEDEPPKQFLPRLRVRPPPGGRGCGPRSASLTGVREVQPLLRRPKNGGRPCHFFWIPAHPHGPPKSDASDVSTQPPPCFIKAAWGAEGGGGAPFAVFSSAPCTPAPCGWGCGPRSTSPNHASGVRCIPWGCPYAVCTEHSLDSAPLPSTHHRSHQPPPTPAPGND